MQKYTVLRDTIQYPLFATCEREIGRGKPRRYHGKSTFHLTEVIVCRDPSRSLSGTKTYPRNNEAGHRGAARRVLDKQPVTGDQLCLRMGGEQRPKVGVPRIGGIAAGDRLAPDGVGDQVGIELMEGFRRATASVSARCVRSANQMVRRGMARAPIQRMPQRSTSTPH